MISHLNNRIRVLEYETLDSTNLELKRLNAPSGTVAVAKSQTSGRGRLGRSFLSPAGGLYISFMADMDLTMTLTARAAVAVARAVEESCKVQLGIKWLNDLTLGNKKVCGILAEGLSDRVIIGIGINIFSVPDEIKDIATSLPPGCDILKLKDALIKTFYDTVSGSCYDYYLSHLTTIGKSVNVIQASELVFSGKAVGLTENYHLLVQDPKGITHELSSGEVTIRCV